MTVSHEQVADLRPGDVVEVVENVRGVEVTYRGALREDDGIGSLILGDYNVRLPGGAPATWFKSLTVVFRASRPPYVNHPRNEPVPGDVVRDADGRDECFYMYAEDRSWASSTGDWSDRTNLPERLRLLVDGETGQVVP